jgi:hypothetical protein
MKPICNIVGIKLNTHKLGVLVSNTLKSYGKTSESSEFNDRLWCCCTIEEAMELAKEFVDIKE